MWYLAKSVCAQGALFGYVTHSYTPTVFITLASCNSGGGGTERFPSITKLSLEAISGIIL